MSTLYTAPVTCSACGSSVYIEVADSLNANRMPAARERVLDRTIFAGECSCGRRITAIHPVLYVDFERGLWVQVASEQNRPRFADLELAALGAYREAFDTKVYPEFVGSLGAMVRPRLAFGYEELREKVVAADAGLDDALVEALKLEIFAARPDLIADGAEVMILQAADPRSLSFAVYRFTPEGGFLIADLGLARSAYDSIARRRAEVERTYPRLFGGVYVNIARYRFGAEEIDAVDSVADGA